MDPWVVLKKQYLDDKISSGGSAARLQSVDGLGTLPIPPVEPTTAEIVSAFHRPVVPSAYAGVLPATSSAYAGVLPATSSGYASVLPTAPSGYASVLPTEPSGYSSFLPTAPITTTITTALMPPPALTASKATATAATLTGQGWYSQSAGRAVNQVRFI